MGQFFDEYSSSTVTPARIDDIRTARLDTKYELTVGYQVQPMCFDHLVEPAWNRPLVFYFHDDHLYMIDMPKHMFWEKMIRISTLNPVVKGNSDIIAIPGVITLTAILY